MWIEYDTMSKLQYILTAAVAILCTVGCNKMSDRVTTQETNFEKYLTNQKVYDREDYDHENDASGATVKFYDRIGGVYRFVANESREDRPAESEALQVGDSAWLYYHAYVFQGTRPGNVYDTNRASIIRSKLPNLNTELWSTDPLEVRLGDGKLMRGLEDGLEGCRAGDSIVLLLTTDLAYGKRPLGVVPQYSPVMFIISIEDIIKQ